MVVKDYIGVEKQRIGNKETEKDVYGGMQSWKRDVVTLLDPYILTTSNYYTNLNCLLYLLGVIISLTYDP